MADKKENKVYRDGLGKIKNPATTLFGKIMTWVLAALMAFTTLFTLIWTIIEMANQ